VALELKKTDPKHSKFTLVVIRTTRRSRRRIATWMKPIQFYTGKDHLLYELVVNNNRPQPNQGIHIDAEKRAGAGVDVGRLRAVVK